MGSKWVVEQPADVCFRENQFGSRIGVLAPIFDQNRKTSQNKRITFFVREMRIIDWPVGRVDQEAASSRKLAQPLIHRPGHAAVHPPSASLRKLFVHLASKDSSFLCLFSLLGSVNRSIPKSLRKSQRRLGGH